MPTGSHDHDHALPDGTTVRIRRLTPDDAGLLLAMWDRTSPRSRRLRFHGPFDLNERNVGVFTDPDPERHVALAATIGRDDDTRLVGVSRYVIDADRPDQAEFAALVEDDHQGRGIGSALVRHVAEAAHDAGVRTLSGDVLAENATMLRVIQDLGLEHTDRHEDHVVRSDLRLDLTEDFLDIVDERGRTAARAALTRFLRPATVAVVGVFDDGATAGDATGSLVVHNLVDGGFRGGILPVGPGSDDVAGLALHARLSDLPTTPELVVVTSEATAVNDIVDEAGQLGVRAVCILSAGFADDGEEGWRRQAELMRRARSHGLRVVGPNCMGVLNLDPQVRLNATITDRLPTPGRTALLSQSGVLGTTILDMASVRGVGLSTFASVGNKADISGNDLLQYWEDDPGTDQVLLYLESFGNPRTFSRIARRVARRKPIVVVKAARGPAGARASTRRTVSGSGDDVAVDALFAQTGVIRTNTLSELFDVAVLLGSQPLVRGSRVGIVGNAGGPGILAADAVEAHGLDVTVLTAGTRSRLRPHIGGDHPANPADVRPGGSVDDFSAAMRILGTSSEVDAILAVMVPRPDHDPSALADALVQARGDIDERITLVAVTMTPDGSVPPQLAAAGIPTHPFPESAAVALGRTARYASWRRRPPGGVDVPDGIDTGRARALVQSALAQTEELEVAHPAARSAWLDPVDAHVLLDHVGITRAPSRFVTTTDGAADAFRELDGPVVVKLVDGKPMDTLLDTVEVGRRSARAAAAAARDLIRRREDGFSATLPRRFSYPTAPQQTRDHPDQLDGPGCRLVVQEVVSGTELAIGVREDPVFGPVVSVGLGGRLADLVGDRTSRVTPLTDRDIDELLADLQVRPLLDGWRGARPADIGALSDLLARINVLVEAVPEVAEVHLNPVFADSDRSVVADVRIRVTPTPRRGPAQD